MQLSLAITTYNRPAETIRSFKSVLRDPRVEEIVIVDDASDISLRDVLKEVVETLVPIEFRSKIKLYYNDQNLGMALNKKRAIELCESEWVLLLDSDNIVDSSYLDAFDERCRNMFDTRFVDRMIFCPEGALPKFTFKDLTGRILDLKYYQSIPLRNHWVLLNVCNYIVNRKTYLETFTYNEHIAECDTIWHAYNHLKVGGVFIVVRGMMYQHAIHEGSAWAQNRQSNRRMFQSIKELIYQLPKESMFDNIKISPPPKGL